jgi:hypothetical protein
MSQLQADISKEKNATGLLKSVQPHSCERKRECGFTHTRTGSHDEQGQNVASHCDAVEFVKPEGTPVMPSTFLERIPVPFGFDCAGHLTWCNVD